jgi:hypothetical protein
LKATRCKEARRFCADEPGRSRNQSDAHRTILSEAEAIARIVRAIRTQLFEAAI